jgi:hypothetical protein
VGVGLSPGDEHYGGPYFYVTPWPYPAPERLPELSSRGHWHTEGFVAAILPADCILEAGGGPEQERETRGFLQEAIRESRSLLLKSADSGLSAREP